MMNTHCPVIRQTSAALFLLLVSSSAFAAFNITSATLNGGATTSIPPSASVSATVALAYSGTTTGAYGSWGSTLWTVNGVSTCLDHANYSAPGPDSVTFNITAPSSPGQYDVTFQAFSSDICSGQNSAAYTLVKGMNVVPSTPIAEYRFDANTPTDSSGNSLNGTLNGGVTTGVAGKVCSAYNFNGTNAFVSVPHNTLLNLSQISVGAWARHTSGTFKTWETILAKGDSTFRLHMNGGCSINTPNVANAMTFAVNAGCSTADDNSGVVPATGQWYHVFGTYDGSTIKIYINGVLQASAAYAGTIGSNTFPLYIGENSEQTGRYWTGDIDEVKIFGYALSAAQVAAGYANENSGKNWDGTARTCAVSGGTPAAFNAVDVGANAVSGKITTKTAGTAFSLDLYALNAARTAQDSTINSSVLVDLLANAAPGVALDANNCPTSYTSLAVGTVTLASGKVTASMGTVANSWRDVRVRLRYPATGTATVTACSSDNFAVKPAALSAIASQADWQTPGSTTTLANSGASGGVVHKAGQPFTVVVTGYNSANAITGNYNGSPTASTACVLPSSGCVAGSFNPGSFSAGGGSVSSSTASYSEVGAIAATFTDSNYASVDSGDTAASCAGYWVCASAINIGRFIPDHFAITPGTLTPRADLSCPASTFTYFGEDFSTAFTLTAQNSANATTQSYSGSLAKLALNTWAGFGFSGVDAITSAAVPVQTGASAPSGSWSNGVASVTATHQATRALSGSANAASNVIIKALPTDSDGVSLPQASAITTTPAVERFGRLRLLNASGSELLPLPVPLNAQYWNGQGFVSNTADNCTILSSPTLTFFPQTADNQLGSGETQASFNTTLVGGNGNLQFSAPGKGNYGFLDLSVAAPAWLQYNWDGVDQLNDGNWFDDNPRARATFGRRSGSNKVIIRRELY